MTTPHKSQFFRAQRLLNYGQWLDDNDQTIRALIELLGDVCMEWCDDDDDDCPYMYKLLKISGAMNEWESNLIASRQPMDLDKFDGKVVLHNRYACTEHRTTLIGQHVEVEEKEKKK
ncbi:MAG: hypothetical protein Unbinned8622contig1003_17 [Prokaryotic dsDNA virus sp.]|nr:MAG: hypothetical protein Unbinned8622contig1003_17 [Prokaryotic dsDNA virus sp.]